MNDKNQNFNYDIPKGDNFIDYNASDSSCSVDVNLNERFHSHYTPENPRKKSLLCVKSKLNFQKEKNNKKHNILIITQTNKKLKLNPSSQYHIYILNILFSYVCGSQKTAKIYEFQSILPQNSTDNLTKLKGNNNYFFKV